ncbi:DsbA family protein [Novosphingobium sp. KCTC 2891]|uniref:DsbA family protein n=1 Tax=Novosphingobium sp. KCTC 2891 TaxID=2989730 RepID=UPI0022223C07|nr:DsbA family protein [Novosphingobium sp. KCTC 2891]MCW1381578.1 DsbA family protein [Novosphingobium sp. KCTC 2891]
MSRLLPRLIAAALVLAAPGLAAAAPSLPLPGEDNGAETPVSATGGWRSAEAVAPLGKADRVYGNADADLTLIVWLDPECPYCKMFGNTGERLVDAAGGRMNLAVRLLPLPFHGEPAMAASAASLCVADQSGPAAYYRFLDAYLAMTATNGRGIAAQPGGGNPITALAGAAGAADTARFNTCLRSTATMRRVLEESDAAQRAGVAGTPAVAIRNNRNGESVMADGAIPEEDIRAAANWLVARQVRPMSRNAPAGS